MLFSTSGFERFEDEACLFGVHSECLLVELCYKRVHIGKRRCNRLPRESTDQVHVVRQGVLGTYIDNSVTKLKRPKKITSRWVVLTRCEKTGQHTLHICKSDSPDSSVKESFPVLTSWSIKSAHCLKSSQRMDIFKEEGFIVHMGRQVLYLSTPTRADCKGWMSSVLEGVTLGFEYHCVCGENVGVNGDCMLVLTPDCIALLCPLTGAPLRKWPYFVLKSCNVVDDTLIWTTRDSPTTYTATVNNHNTLTLYNVLCRYMAHTNPEIQVEIQVGKSDNTRSRSQPRAPAENKYSIPGGPAGLSINELYRSHCQDPIATMAGSPGKNGSCDGMSSSDYSGSTGMSSCASNYDSDIYEQMEASARVCDSIYEDMATTSSTDHLLSSPSDHHIPRSIVGPMRTRGESSPAEMYINMDRARSSNPAPPRTSNTGAPRPTGPNYEYIDIELNRSHPGASPTTPAPPAPQLPTRNKPKKPDMDAFQRAKISAGLKTYQERMKLEREMMVNFTSAVLDSSPEVHHKGSMQPINTHNRTYMNSAV